MNIFHILKYHHFPKKQLAERLEQSLFPLKFVVYSYATIYCPHVNSLFIESKKKVKCNTIIYVVVEELVPEMAAEEENVHSNLGTIMFMIVFFIMMMLDVALG